MRSEPQGIVLAFDVFTPILPSLVNVINLMSVRSVVQRFNSAQINLMVTCTDDCTCHHLTIHAKNSMLWDKWEVWNKCRHLPIAIPVARLASLNAFLYSQAKKYLYVVIYLPLTVDITIWHTVIQNRTMRSEWQHIVLAFDIFPLYYRLWVNVLDVISERSYLLLFYREQHSKRIYSSCIGDIGTYRSNGLYY